MAFVGSESERSSPHQTSHEALFDPRRGKSNDLRLPRSEGWLAQLKRPSLR